MYKTSKLVLENGSVFTGSSFGIEGETIGEVCFNTGMTGYQEILTDPSYCGQLITMTYPHIGNYGVNPEDVESNKEKLKAEEAESFDIGYETYLDKFNLGLNVSLFKLKQTDPIVSQSRTGWLQKNAHATNESEGIEFSTNWTPNNITNIIFNYTFTDSFDSASCENPDRTKTLECFHEGTQVDQAKVRVPKHAFNSSIYYNASKNLKHSLLVKYLGERREFGNVNNGWTDVILKEYILFDVASTYNLWDYYKIDFSLRNIFNERHEQAYEYSGMERAINFGIRKLF